MKEFCQGIIEGIKYLGIIINDLLNAITNNPFFMEAKELAIELAKIGHPLGIVIICGLVILFIIKNKKKILRIIIWLRRKIYIHQSRKIKKRK